MIRRAVLSLIFAAFGSVQSTAQPITGNTLHSACNGQSDAEAGFCIGYIIGSLDGQRWGAFSTIVGLELADGTSAANDMIARGLRHCIPPEAPNEQIRDVVLQFLTNNPSMRHESARFLVWFALAEAFSCTSD